MKKMTKIGIILFIISLLIIYISAINFENSFTGSSLQEMSVLPHNTLYASFNLTNATIVGVFYYTNGTTANFFFVNQTGFSRVSSQVNSNQPINRTEIEGHGAIELVYNGIAGVFPYQQLNSTTNQTYVYAPNYSPVLPTGNYYAIFENPNNSSVQIFYSIILKAQSAISNTIFSSAVYGIIGAAMFFSGIVLILYSILLKPKKEEQLFNSSEEIEKLYAKQASRRKHKGHRKKGNAKR